MFNKKLLIALLATSVLSASTVLAEDVANSAANVNAGGSVVSGAAVSSASSESLDDEFGDLGDLGDLESSSTSSTGTADTGSIGWGYTANDSVTVLDTSMTGATLQSPAIKDGNGNVIKMYKVVTSTKSIKESDALTLKESVITLEQITGDVVTLTVSGLAPATTYYFVVTPMKEESSSTVNGQESTEASFTTKDAGMHGAAGTGATVDMSTANVSYSFTGSKVKLIWTPIAGAEKIEIFLAADTEKDKTKIGEANMADGTFEFDVTKAGSYNVTLMPTNSDGTSVGAEYVQKVEVSEVVAKEVVAPKVGPATNMLIALLIVSSILYFGLRFRKN